MATINRISVGLVIVGVVGVALTGGNPDSAVSLGGAIAVAVGGIIGLVKEVIQTLKAGA